MSHHFDTPTAKEDPRINVCDFSANLRRLRRRREAFAPDLCVRELIHDR
jgi:hypothetical protein